MTVDHHCARPGCVVEVPGYQFACRPHWLELPQEIRTRIVRAWAQRRRRPTSADAIGAHLDAALEAMGFWIGPVAGEAKP